MSDVKQTMIRRDNGDSGCVRVGYGRFTLNGDFFLNAVLDRTWEDMCWYCQVHIRKFPGKHWW